LLLIQWLSINFYRCTRPSATVANPHIVLSLGSKETHIQSHNHRSCCAVHRLPCDGVTGMRVGSDRMTDDRLTNTEQQCRI